TDVRGEVEHGAAPADQFQILRECLELPRDALGQRRGVHVLDVLERAHDHVVVLGPDRRDREAAVARHHGGDTVEARRLERRIPEHLRVVVGVDVDEAGRNGAARRVELALASQLGPDLADHTARDRHVGDAAGFTAPVEDRSTANDEFSRQMEPPARVAEPPCGKLRRMIAQRGPPTRDALSIVTGSPLSGEPGLGALTIPGYLREVTTRFAEREALVRRSAGGALRWTYANLWERSIEVARALIAGGIGKNSRVGVLMTNRPDFLSAVFGTGLAGGVAVPLSTFSTPPELRYLLRTSAVSTLLFEATVLTKNFQEMLIDLEREIDSATPGQLISREFPFLRRLAVVGDAAGGSAIETWSDFLARGKALSPAIVEATAAAVSPSDAGMLFFSSGTSDQPNGILNSHRAVAIQLWRWRRLYDNLEDDVRCWPANGFFWSGVFSMALGLTFSYGGALVLQPTFEAAEALELIQVEKVSLPLCWPHQWSRLAEASNGDEVDLSSLRYVDFRSPLGRHPTVRTQWREPR